MSTTTQLDDAAQYCDFRYSNSAVDGNIQNELDDHVSMASQGKTEQPIEYSYLYNQNDGKIEATRIAPDICMDDTNTNRHMEKQ